jgi:hypothetical protein
MATSKRTRFEVFKRDKFTCQYCGRSGPNVLLELDHIVPKSEGGSDDILNLVTSCADCNRGKGPKRLSDDTAVAKQRRQLEELQERREQLEMMLEWQRSLMDAEGKALDELADIWGDLAPGYRLNERGIQDLKRLLNGFEIPELVECMKISVGQYLRYEDQEPSNPTKASVEKAWDYVGRIAASRRKVKQKPYLSDLYFIVNGILKKQYPGVPKYEVIGLLEKTYLSGVTIAELREVATRAVTRAYSYRGFEHAVEDLVQERQAN